MNKTQLAEFDRFYRHYPKKMARGDAEKAWETLEPDSQLVDEMIEAVQKQARVYEKENGGNKKFFKNPGPWLRQKCWMDEVQEKKQKVRKTTICAKCHQPATNKGKLGVDYCADHWDAGDPERAEALKEHFISLGIKQDENGWKTPCLKALKSMAFGKLIGGG